MEHDRASLAENLVTPVSESKLSGRVRVSETAATRATIGYGLEIERNRLPRSDDFDGIRESGVHKQRVIAARTG